MEVQDYFEKIGAVLTAAAGDDELNADSYRALLDEIDEEVEARKLAQAVGLEQEKWCGEEKEDDEAPA